MVAKIAIFVIEAVLFGVLYFLVYYTLYKIPYLKLDKITAEQRALAKEYQKKFFLWEMLGLGLFFVTTALFTWFYVGLFLWIYDFIHQGAYVFLLATSMVFWFLPALFLGIISSSLPMFFIFTVLMGAEKYQEYVFYNNIKAGFDTVKALFVMSIFILGLAFIAIPLALDCYVKVKEKEILINDFFSLQEQKYSFSDIKQVRLVKSFKAPNGNIVRHPFYEIVFKNSYIWSSKNTLLDFPQQKKDFVDFLCEKSNNKLKEIDPFDGK